MLQGRLNGAPYSQGTHRFIEVANDLYLLVNIDFVFLVHFNTCMNANQVGVVRPKNLRAHLWPYHTPTAGSGPDTYIAQELRKYLERL